MGADGGWHTGRVRGDGDERVCMGGQAEPREHRVHHRRQMPRRNHSYIPSYIPVHRERGGDARTQTDRGRVAAFRSA
jgi:hypothetical protein